MDPAQLKKVLKYKEIKSNFGFHSDGKTFALEKYQRFHAEGCVKHNDCIFSTKVGALIALEIETNGAHLGKNKASPCSSSLQGHMEPSGAPLCLWHRELGIPWDRSSREHTMGEGVSAPDNHHCSLCSTRGLIGIPRTAAGAVTQRMGQNSHKPQNTDVRTVGKKTWKEKMEKQVLSRTLVGDFQLCPGFISTCCAALLPECPWEQKEMMAQLTWFQGQVSGRSLLQANPNNHEMEESTKEPK